MLKQIWAAVEISLSILAAGQPVFACGGATDDYRVNILTEGQNWRISMVNSDGTDKKSILDDDGFVTLYLAAVSIGKTMEKEKQPSSTQIAFMKQQLTVLETRLIANMGDLQVSKEAQSKIKNEIRKLREVLNSTPIPDEIVLWHSLTEINGLLGDEGVRLQYNSKFKTEQKDSLRPFADLGLPSMMKFRGGCNSGISDFSVPTKAAPASGISFDIKE